MTSLTKQTLISRTLPNLSPLDLTDTLRKGTIDAFDRGKRFATQPAGCVVPTVAVGVEILVWEVGEGCCVCWGGFVEFCRCGSWRSDKQEGKQEGKGKGEEGKRKKGGVVRVRITY